MTHYTKDDLVAVDPSRIAAVVTGIGLLGAGAILRTGLNVQGPDDCRRALAGRRHRMAAGAGMYAKSVAATLFGIVALVVLRRFEHKDDQLRRRISVVLADGGTSVPGLLRALAQTGVAVAPMEYERRLDERRIDVTLQARIPPESQEGLVDLLESQPGLERVRIEPVA